MALWKESTPCNYPPPKKRTARPWVPTLGLRRTTFLLKWSLLRVDIPYFLEVKQLAPEKMPSAPKGKQWQRCKLWVWGERIHVQLCKQLNQPSRQILSLNLGWVSRTWMVLVVSKGVLEGDDDLSCCWWRGNPANHLGCKNPRKYCNGIKYLSTGAGFLPSTVRNRFYQKEMNHVAWFNILKHQF